jgi:hypothetical protein
VLKSRDVMPSPDEQEALIRASVHGQMLTDWRESEVGSLRFRLFEHEYQVPVEPDDKKIVVGTVMRSLRNFFKSPILAEAFAAGRERWLSVEDLVSFSVGDVPVFLRMDLAFRGRDGRVVIVDWKTGRGEGKFSEVQVAGYALYAAEQGWAAPEEIQTELAYLAIPRYVRRSVDRRKLDHLRAFVARSAKNMRGLLLDPLANLARLEDFPMIDRPQACRRCNFRRRDGRGRDPRAPARLAPLKPLPAGLRWGRRYPMRQNSSTDIDTALPEPSQASPPRAFDRWMLSLLQLGFGTAPVGFVL